MGLFNFLKAKPRQPELAFAAEGFGPLAVMVGNNVEIDPYAIAEGFALSRGKDGCTDSQVRSIHWGGLCAISVDYKLYRSMVTSYEDTLVSEGIPVRTDPEGVKSKHIISATLYLSCLLASAPSEYERYLKASGY